MIKGKKANVFDVLSFTEGIVKFIVVILIMGILMFAIGTQMSTMSQFSVSSVFIEWMINYPVYFDWMILIIYAASITVSVIFARFIPTNVVYMGVATISYIIIAVIIMIFANIVKSILTQPIFSTVAAKMPITSFFVEYMLIFGIFYMIFTFVALYSGKDE